MEEVGRVGRRAVGVIGSGGKGREPRGHAAWSFQEGHREREKRRGFRWVRSGVGGGQQLLERDIKRVAYRHVSNNAILVPENTQVHCIFQHVGKRL